MKADATKPFVLDASMTLAWCFADEATTHTEAVLDRLANGVEAVAPALWPFEVANALLVAERRKRITTAQVTSVLQRIMDLPIRLDAPQTRTAFFQILFLARQQRLTEYDAAYLELAMREGLPLATLDDQLRAAAKAAGIELLKS